MIKALNTKLRYARRFTWASYSLFMLSLLGGGYISGTPATLLAFASLPLILMLPGMARENYKSLSMLSFVTLLYFVPLVVNMGKSDHDVFDLTSLILICILFTSSMMFSRWRQYELAGYGQPSTTDSPPKQD